MSEHTGGNHAGENDDGDARRIEVDGRLIFDERLRRRCQEAIETGSADMDLADILSQMIYQKNPSYQALHYLVKIVLTPPAT